MANNAAVIIVKKVKKGGHAHHGGAWKVAYADFVTAMMAFFLLLWLLNATTEDQRKGISDYFAPASVSQSSSGAGGILGGRTIAEPGAMTTGTAKPSVSVPLTPSEGRGESDKNKEGAESGEDLTGMTPRQVEELLEQREQEAFEKAQEELQKAIGDVPELREFSDNVLIDQTPEGLRIQIVDQKGRPMFPLGEAKMFERTKRLMAEIAKVVAKLPNKVSVTGHTDAIPFRGAQKGYGNWELSSDRALESRRVLVEGGLAMNRITKVVGRAAEDPLVPEDPANAKNRRISIIVLKQAGQKGQTVKKAPTEEFRRSFNGPRVR